MLSKRILMIFLLANALIGGTYSYAQDVTGFDVKSCTAVNENDSQSIAFNAKWCRSSGATRTINQQVGELCAQYRFSYGNAHQHELLRLAIVNAKKAEYYDAVAMIAACQCHNPTMHELSYVQARPLICWLRDQKH
jgi:hypothetical protein